MREVKFRGISKKTGKFVFGWLQDNFINISESNEFEWWGEEIIKGTEGQYTGLKDLNGKEIYEGDIIEGKPIISLNNTKLRGVVIFSDYGYKVRVYFDDGEYEDEYLPEILKDVRHEAEVIGNIHENQDLIQ